ncbi:ADP-ribosylation factor GTPase-activating protein effector protein 2 [Nakaseomyces bracarensis]|uniref:ADP-ribosylation factor GTPase-activating protein effector protein 2 n=1 Tax=Nakaseomyces bracarensis TaxID=273131 RepID=A0ABR4NX34_9SACH
MTSVPVKKALGALLRDPGNTTCADCKTQSHPRWASWSLGVFICIKCAGIHRSLGTHISKVKSVDLDTWKEENLKELVRMRNNQCANMVYEAKLPETSKFRSKNLGNDTNLLQEFIRQKYERKKWTDFEVDLASCCNGSSGIASSLSSTPTTNAVERVESSLNSSSNSSLVSTMSSSNNSETNVSTTENNKTSSILNLQTRKDVERTTVPKSKPRQETPQRNDLKKSILSLYSAPSKTNSNSNSSLAAQFPQLSNPTNQQQNSSSLSIDDDELFKNVWS